MVSNNALLATGNALSRVLGEFGDWVFGDHFNRVFETRSPTFNPCCSRIKSLGDGQVRTMGRGIDLLAVSF